MAKYPKCREHVTRWFRCKLSSDNCDRTYRLCKSLGGRIHQGCKKCGEVFDMMS